MTSNKALTLASAAVFAALVAGCNKPDPPKVVEAPQVTDENCKPESIATVDASVRQQFADACSRRGSFKPSTGKTW